MGRTSQLPQGYCGVARRKAEPFGDGRQRLMTVNDRTRLIDRAEQKLHRVRWSFLLSTVLRQAYSEGRALTELAFYKYLATCKRNYSLDDIKAYSVADGVM